MSLTATGLHSPGPSPEGYPGGTRCLSYPFRSPHLQARPSYLFPGIGCRPPPDLSCVLSGYKGATGTPCPRALSYMWALSLQTLSLSRPCPAAAAAPSGLCEPWATGASGTPLLGGLLQPESRLPQGLEGRRPPSPAGGVPRGVRGRPALSAGGGLLPEAAVVASSLH